MDSTGLQFSNASHWHEEKYGKTRAKKPWRKLRLSMGTEREVFCAQITECDEPDGAVIDDLFSEEDLKIEKVTADKAYYSIEGGEALYKKGIIPVIAPPHHSVVPNQPTTTWHDQIVRSIKNKGSIYALHKKYG